MFARRGAFAPARTDAAPPDCASTRTEEAAVPNRNVTAPSAISYRIVPQAPPLSPRELEEETQAIEVTIVWGELSVLHVAHLSPPRSFYVGEEAGADFVIGAQTLGRPQLPIVLDDSSESVVVIPEGAYADFDRDGARIADDELEAQLRTDHSGARLFPLRRGITARVQLGDFTFIVQSVAAGRRLGVARIAEPNWRRSRWTLASAALHMGLLGLCYFLPPSSSALSMDRLDTESRLVKYAIEAQQPPIEDVPPWMDPGGTKGGERAAGDSGEAGAPNKPKTNKRMAVPGHSPTLQLAQDQRTEASTAGIIGVLLAVGPRDMPASPYSKSQAIGSDAAAVLGRLLGTDIGESGGSGGLDMIGTGKGGGGDAVATIGLGHGLGTRGRGNGNGDGEGDGYGSGVGGLRQRRNERVPRIRVNPPEVMGSLSKETIRRYIGRHIAEVRYCYESQLNTRPDLQGRVAIKFVIAPTGAVTSAVVANSDVGSPEVDSCIANTVRRINFPAPEGGGLVIVTYPFLLSQTGS
jgi:TonB family protein